MKPSKLTRTALPCLAFLLTAPALRAAPEPAIVRLTSVAGGQYMDHGGGNKTGVYATTTAPIDFDSAGNALVTAGPDIWRLVDWNGGELRSGDAVSFATQTTKEPYYLHASSCSAGAKPDTKKQATWSAGLTSEETFTIVLVTIAPICSQYGCLARYVVATPGTLIDNGSMVAIQTPQTCFLYRSNDGTVLADRTAVNNLAPVPVWRLWYKMVPRHDDSFPGHMDGCFGGMGAGCWENPSLWPFSGTGTWRTAPSGSGFHTFKTVDVSVGSIAHDNCCVRNPLGKVCGGVFSGSQQTKSGDMPGKGLMSLFDAPGAEAFQGTRCEWEWARAVDAFTLFNTWTHEFGPYYSDATRACPGCRTKGELAWGLTGDVLDSRSTSRRVWMAHDFTWKKWIDDVASNYPDANETAATAALKAPAGTHIYPTGAYPSNKVLGDFCATGTAQWDPVNAWTCSAISCTSGLAHWDVWSFSWQCDSP